MERIEGRKAELSWLWPVLTVAAVGFAIGIVLYGLDSVAPGVHDAFHDFRHTIGMPCH